MSQLFSEKYRPSSIEEAILPARIKNIFLNDADISQHYLLYGSPGMGKTSVARILAKGKPFIYINVSDESSVDTVRDKITTFCSTMSVLDSPDSKKIVILDEVDGASDQFYKALRATIERFHKQARFIATCNFINKVPEPVQSRFICINFDPITNEEEKLLKIELFKRLQQIFRENGITIEKNALIEFLKRNFPDMRSIMNKIQMFKTQGINNIDLNTIKVLNYNFADLFNLILNAPDPINNYKFIMANYSSRVDDVLNALGSEFIDFIIEYHKPLEKFIPQIIIKVAYYQSIRTQVIDSAISLLSCVYECQLILNQNK
jgi:replication factor C small subunit